MKPSACWMPPDGSGASSTRWGKRQSIRRMRLDRITQLTDAINGVTQFGYDANSNLLTVTDAKSQQTVYTPNMMNRTTQPQRSACSHRDLHL